MVDAEQIESIISTFNDMGIQSTTRLRMLTRCSFSETAPAGVPDEDAEEEAKRRSPRRPRFGRTPTRCACTLREMDRSELLTREGEIEIAKGSRTA